MDNSVIIKGSNNGISIVLDEKLSFDEIKEKLTEKIKDSSKFLGNNQTAVAFTGKELSAQEELELMKVISDNSELDVVCILDKNEEHNKIFEDAVAKKAMSLASADARIFKGSLRSGQSVEMDSSVIILGDVNPGASVISSGNIIVMGTLKGTAFAGCSGNKNCFVISLDMIPMQVRIADIIARAPDNQSRNVNRETKIAYIEEDCICIAPLTKEIINGITID